MFFPAKHLRACLRAQVNTRPRRKRYIPTTGLVLERLPITLEQHVKNLGDALGAPQALDIGVQIVEGLLHLHTCLLYTSPSPRDRG